MNEAHRRDVSDQYICKTQRNIRHGNFFSKPKLPLQKWLLMLYMWAREYPVTDAAQEADIRLREMCSTKLLQTAIILEL